MTFLSVNMFWHLLWIIPLIFVASVAGAVRRKSLFRKIFGSCERASQFSDASRGKRIFRAVLIVSAVLLLVAAAARPSWGKQDMLDDLPEEARGIAASDGHDLLVLFDVSKSMLSDDVRPTRMAHAKWLVRKIAGSAPGNRFGLIPFAGDAFLVCPLTLDNSNLFRILDDLDTDTVPVGGTNVQFALEEAVKAFQDSPGRHKAVILVTDGDELTGESADVIDELKNAQIPIFAVGVGDPTNPAAIRTPGRNGELQVLLYNGDPVKSPLNEPWLQELASQTGGFYVRSTTAHDGVDEIMRHIEMLDRKEGEKPASSFRPIEHPAYPLAAALILLAVFFCISETRPRPVQTVLLLAALILFSAPAESRAQSAPASEKETGTKQTEAEPLAAAEKTTEDATAGQKDMTPSELYNAGLELQQEKHDYENARILYERAIAGAGKEPDIRASAYQNLGVISHLEARSGLKEAEDKLQAQDYKAAEKTLLDAERKLKRTEELYRESMRSDANSASAIRNQQMLLAELKQVDRMNARIEEWKKKQEELKKLAEQAAKQTQQAHDRQQQENRRQEQRKEREEETKKLMEQAQEKTREARDIQQQENRRQERQDRNSAEMEQAMEQAREKLREARDVQQQENARGDRQPDSENRQNAQESAREAEEAVSELEQKASDANREAQEQAARQALEEIRKAIEEQQQSNGEKAEEHLENALDELEQDRLDQQQSEQDQQQSEQDQQQSEQDQQAGGENRQNQQQNAQESAREAEEAVSELEQKASEADQEAQEQAARQAREEIRKAREEQRQGNGEKAEEHLENALDELKQGQQQAEQEQQERRQAAQDETRQAEQSLSELEKMASEMNRQMQQQAAKQALEELRKALEEQQQGNGEKAEEHLKNALETLKREQQEQQKRQEEQDRRDQEEQNEQDERKEQEGQEEQNEQTSGEAEPQNTDEPFDMDKHQAEAILNRMLKDELKLRDVSPTRHGRNQNVEKDW